MEQGQVHRFGTPAESAIKSRDKVVIVAARGWDIADPRTPFAAQAQNKVIEQRIVGLHQEAAAAHRNDMPLGHSDRAAFAKPAYIFPIVAQLQQHFLGMLPVLRWLLRLLRYFAV